MIGLARNPKRQARSRRWNDRFLELLPSIREQAEYAFRGLPIETREELIQEVIARAYGLFVSLCRRGKLALVYPTPLTKFAIRNVREGRRIGSRCNSQDITSPSVCAEKRIKIERLDRLNRRSGHWREVLVADRTAGPADTAIARIDWTDWLASMSRRQRAIASVLASGETTGAVARKFRISSARISQLRVWFMENWNEFHGQQPSRQCG